MNRTDVVLQLRTYYVLLTMMEDCGIPEHLLAWRSIKEQKMNEIIERIIDLETRFAHQELQLDELNTIVIECRDRIDRLERDNRRMSEMLAGMAPESMESPDE
ncbi:MAG: SlyX family protein [Desulfuromonadaceae bacterium]|nr:SlyX family protein [Desulfuromonadaceae bacterium]